MGFMDLQKSMLDVKVKATVEASEVCAGKYEIKAIRNLKFTEKAM